MSKKKLITASAYMIDEEDRGKAESACEKINSEIKSMNCSNIYCTGEISDKRESEYRIGSIYSLTGMSHIQYTSSKWCCNDFMREVESRCYSLLKEEFGKYRIEIRADHFYQEY